MVVRSWAFSPSYHISGLQPDRNSDGHLTANAGVKERKACDVIARAEGPG